VRWRIVMPSRTSRSLMTSTACMPIAAPPTTVMSGSRGASWMRPMPWARGWVMCRPTGSSTALDTSWTEDETPNPVNLYGYLKAASELVVLHRASSGFVARVGGCPGVASDPGCGAAEPGCRLRLLRPGACRRAPRRASGSPSGRTRPSIPWRPRSSRRRSVHSSAWRSTRGLRVCCTSPAARAVTRREPSPRRPVGSSVST
jgi:hypothetical protein